MPRADEIERRAGTVAGASVVGDHHVISVDGQQMLDFKDQSFASGMAGLRSRNYSKVNLRSLKVSKAK